MKHRIVVAVGVGTVIAAMSIWLFALSSETSVASEYPIDELMASVERFGERLELVEDLAANVDERNAGLRTVVGGLQVAALEAETHPNLVLSEAVSFLLDEQEKSARTQIRDRDRWRLVAQYAIAAQAFNVGLGVLFHDPSYTDVVAEQVGQAVAFDPALVETWTAVIASEMPVEVFGRALQSRLYGALVEATTASAPQRSGQVRPPLDAQNAFEGY